MCIYITTRGAHRVPHWNPSSLDITGMEEDVQVFIEPTLGDILATLVAPFQVHRHGTSKRIRLYLKY